MTAGLRWLATCCAKLSAWYGIQGQPTATLRTCAICTELGRQMRVCAHKLLLWVYTRTGSGQGWCVQAPSAPGTSLADLSVLCLPIGVTWGAFRAVCAGKVM